MRAFDNPADTQVKQIRQCFGLGAAPTDVDAVAGRRALARDDDALRRAVTA